MHPESPMYPGIEEGAFTRGLLAWFKDVSGIPLSQRAYRPCIFCRAVKALYGELQGVIRM